MEKQKCLKNLSVFSRLSDEELQLVCEKARGKKYEKGQIIFFENDSPKDLYMLAEGQVKLSMMSPEGQEKVLTILQEGDLFGEISLFDDTPYPLTAEAQQDSKLFIISWSDLEKIIMERPSMALKIIKALAKKTRLLTSQVRELVFQDAGGRLAALLQRFCDEFGMKIEQGTRIELILTHQEIANLLGTSRVTVTKLMNEFIDQGIIKIEERKIIVLDVEKLQEKIEFEE
ncbi:MAG: Crp/Fnr family transcriptional regulator [Bacillota bacterium]